MANALEKGKPTVGDIEITKAQIRIQKAMARIKAAKKYRGGSDN
jgi:hypothetical protein